MLEVVRNHFGITTSLMYREIQQLHEELIEILNSKGIKYESLRAALVPVMDRQEAAFIFDSAAFDSGLYGREAFTQVLPLLEPKATQRGAPQNLDRYDSLTSHKENHHVQTEKSRPGVQSESRPRGPFGRENHCSAQRRTWSASNADQ